MNVTEAQYEQLQAIFPGCSIDIFSDKTGITVYVVKPKGDAA